MVEELNGRVALVDGELRRSIDEFLVAQGARVMESAIHSRTS